jgi:hypothetical protein
LTATVSPSVATGTVTFYNGTTSIGSGTLSSGTATVTTTFGAVGTESITATYGGSSTYAASNSNAASVTVTAPAGGASISTPLQVLAPTAKEDANVTLTAAVSSTNATGTVTFYDSSTLHPLGTGTVSAGSATLSTKLSMAGMHRITATYTASGSNGASPTLHVLSFSINR